MCTVFEPALAFSENVSPTLYSFMNKGGTELFSKKSEPWVARHCTQSRQGFCRVDLADGLEPSLMRIPPWHQTTSCLEHS